MMAGDGVKQREIVHQVTSVMTGSIIVEDVIYENGDDSFSGFTPSKDMKFRRLTFQRSSGLVQSEAILTREGCSKDIPDKMETKKTNSISKSKKKVSRKSNSSPLTDGLKTIPKVDHQYLASSYHAGIISGFMLVASNLQCALSSGRMAKTVIVGLGAGLLPMFLRGCLPCLDIEVVELDPVVPRLAKDYFGFVEDKQLKVHVKDGIEFVRKFAPATSKEKSPSAEAQERGQIDILIVDVDSSDSSSGMTCPHPDFVEAAFLVSVKESLSEGGLFVINLVSRSAAIREKVIAKIKTVFSNLYSLQLEEDVNEVLFALRTDSHINDDIFPDATLQLEKLLKFTHRERVQDIIDSTKKIKSV